VYSILDMLDLIFVKLENRFDHFTLQTVIVRTNLDYMLLDILTDISLCCLIYLPSLKIIYLSTSTLGLCRQKYRGKYHVLHIHHNNQAEHKHIKTED
jgi:hypothetical protein